MLLWKELRSAMEVHARLISWHIYTDTQQTIDEANLCGGGGGRPNLSSASSLSHRA